MKNLNVRVVVYFLPVCIAFTAKGQSPAQSPAPVKLSEQVNTNYNKMRIAVVKAINDKYAQLSLAAMALFVKENNQPRADEAKDWARRLGWTDDVGNFNGLTPDAKDRLGALQNFYLKERSNAVMTLDKAWWANVEAAQKQAAQQGDKNGAGMLAQLLVEMKKDLAGPDANRPGPGTAAAQAPAQLTPAQKMVADFSDARTAAVKGVNVKYARLSLLVVDLFVKENNQPRADEATDWARRLGWTDDVGNFKGLTPDTEDRLGALQKAYLKDRADAVAVVDKARWADLEEARQQVIPEKDMKGTVGLVQTLDLIRHDLGITSTGASAPPESGAAASSGPPPARPATSPGAYHPFGVEGDKPNPGATP